MSTNESTRLLRDLESVWREAEAADLIVGCWYDREALVADARCEGLTHFNLEHAEIAFGQLRDFIQNTGGFDREHVIEAIHEAVEK